MAANPALRRDRGDGHLTRSLTMRGYPIWAPTRCEIYPVPSEWYSCAIPDMVNEFPPLRVSKAVVFQHLPAQLTIFMGRNTELSQVASC